MTDQTPLDAVVIERTFDEAADHIWQMWTEPEHFNAWYGPDGAAIPVTKMDVRVGGTRLVCMQMPTPDGPTQMWFTGEYREVVPNERLVYAESVCDENGNVLSPSDVGMPGGIPQPPRSPSNFKKSAVERTWCWHMPASPQTPPARPVGRWRSPSLPPMSKHTASDRPSWAHQASAARVKPAPKRAHLEVLASHKQLTSRPRTTCCIRRSRVASPDPRQRAGIRRRSKAGLAGPSQMRTIYAAGLMSSVSNAREWSGLRGQHRAWVR